MKYLEREVYYSRMAQIPMELRELMVDNPIVNGCACEWARGDSSIKTFYTVLVINLASHCDRLQKEIIGRALNNPPPIYLVNKPA